MPGRLHDPSPDKAVPITFDKGLRTVTTLNKIDLICVIRD